MYPQDLSSSGFVSDTYGKQYQQRPPHSPTTSTASPTMIMQPSSSSSAFTSDDETRHPSASSKLSDFIYYIMVPILNLIAVGLSIWGTTGSQIQIKGLSTIVSKASPLNPGEESYFAPSAYHVFLNHYSDEYNFNSYALPPCLARKYHTAYVFGILGCLIMIANCIGFVTLPCRKNAVFTRKFRLGQIGSAAAAWCCMLVAFSISKAGLYTCDGMFSGFTTDTGGSYLVAAFFLTGLITALLTGRELMCSSGVPRLSQSINEKNRSQNNKLNNL